MKKGYTFSRVAALLVFISIFTLTLSGCFNTGDFSNDAVITPDSVVTRLDQDERIPSFDTTAFANVELCFRTYYYTDLPENEILARDTVDAFFEFCYEKVDLSSKEKITRALIECYIYAIGDIYSFYRTSDELQNFNNDMSGSFVGIGVSVIRNNLENTILVTGVEIGSPAEKAGILPDDYIVAVNGERVSDIGNQEAVNKIRGEIDTPVTVTVLRGDEEITFEMIRARITETTVAYKFIEGTKTAYVSITGFKGNTQDQFKEAIDAIEAAGADSVIFDLCGNPGGYLSAVTSMLSYLVPTGTAIASFSNSKSPIYATDGSSYEPEDHILNIPSVVLCDSSSASASELFSAAMRDYDDMGILKSTLVGEVTYKKGIMQSTLAFKDGSALTLTTALYNPPSGTNFHGVGVTPDIIMPSGSDYTAQALVELELLKQR